ncbi:hypothetical protein BGX26_008100 [Mortierella sp. AD094]|nr:hypothetical protein BGX26_008100 [Mortierella sp. AD094]
MLFKTIATTLAVAGVAAAQNSTGNYTHGSAHIQMNKIDATFTFEKVDTGVNVTVAVASGLTEAFQILPAGFEYHVHDFPVGANNSCAATGGHLDPANVGTLKPCDPKNLTSCQVGDMSGKHGNLIAANNDTGLIATFSYIDTQLTFSGPLAGALLGRSVVIHNNGTRVGCADLVVEGYVVPAGNSTNGTNPTNGTTTTPGNKPASGAAKLVGSVALTGLVAAMMLIL